MSVLQQVGGAGHIAGPRIGWARGYNEMWITWVQQEVGECKALDE